MSVAIVADAHLGGPGGAAGPLVKQLLELPERGCRHLVLLGDIFQVWMGSPHWETPEVREVVPALRRLRADRGEEALAPLRRYHEALVLSLSGRAAEGRDLLRREVKPQAPAPVRIVQALAALEVETGNPSAALDLLRNQARLAGDEGAMAEILAAQERGEPPPPPVRDATSGMADALLGVAEALGQQRADRWDGDDLGTFCQPFI